MARAKLEADMVKEKVHQACEQIVETTGTEPTVAEVSAVCNMSNRETGPLVKAWKTERAAAAQVIKLSSETVAALDEIRGLSEKLVKSAMSAMYRDHEAAMHAAMTEADANLQRETEASHDRIDALCSELAHKDNRIHELQSENQRLLDALIEEKAARKALEIVIAKQIPEITPPQQTEHPIQTASMC